jgi:DNA-binding NarL/FixJ family response regulator
VKTHARKIVLRKIARRRQKSSNLSDMTLLTSDPVVRAQSTLGAGYSMLLLGKRILTPREVEVLRLVARGETDRGIAERLYLSRRTVSSHVSNILSKLDAPSRREAVRAAARIGLL